MAGGRRRWRRSSVVPLSCRVYAAWRGPPGGGGPAPASDPAAELAESEAKLEPMRHALGSD
ncbi:hypothetical protein, partial [Actinotalea sp. K2]|uniref:hypothetical protein n=1 Tax=Actinotalea sp. K2 TaxID=2939438 RepID=UPI0035A88A6A